MLVTQAIVMAGLVGFALNDPSRGLGSTVFWVALIAFGSATQDLVIDAYRIELLDESQMGAGAAMNSIGYRIAILVAGGGCLILAQLAGWTTAYLAMAGLMAVGMIVTLVCTDHAQSWTQRRTSGSYADLLHKAVIAPFADLMTRPGWP